MENLDLKINYIIGKIGVMPFLSKLGISYTLWKKLKSNYDLFTIGQINIIDFLYNELRNE